MKRFQYTLWFVTTIIVTSVIAIPCFAISFGVYGKAGVSTSTYSFSPMAKTPNDHLLGFGLVLDTAVAKSKTFNYRLNIGYENVVDSGNPLFMNQSMHRIDSYHSFGLSPMANKYIRLWLGPSIGFHYQFANQRFRDTSKFNYFTSSSISDIKRVVHLALFDIGCLFGINIHLGDKVSVSAECGIYVGAGIGTEQTTRKKYTVLRDLYSGAIGGFFPYRTVGGKSDVAMGKAETLLKLSVLYRIGDVYDPTDSDIQKSYRFNKEVVKE